jgi:hypothetical protein
MILLNVIPGPVRFSEFAGPSEQPIFDESLLGHIEAIWLSSRFIEFEPL